MNAQLKEFAQKKSWHSQMSESKGLDSFSNYSGPGFEFKEVVL